MAIGHTHDIITSFKFLSRQFRPGGAPLGRVSGKRIAPGRASLIHANLSMILSRNFCTTKSKMALTRLIRATIPQ